MNYWWSMKTYSSAISFSCVVSLLFCLDLRDIILIFHSRFISFTELSYVSNSQDYLQSTDLELCHFRFIWIFFQHQIGDTCFERINHKGYQKNTFLLSLSPEINGSNTPLFFFRFFLYSVLKKIKHCFFLSEIPMFCTLCTPARMEICKSHHWQIHTRDVHIQH